MTMLTIRIVKTLTVVSILAVCHCATIIQGQQERQAVAVAGREGAVQEEESSEAEEESEEESFYFYLPDRSSPIYEEVPPIDPTRDKPDWIFNPNSGHRLVEFYAHWCPHCQAFRQHYIDFAYSMKEMSKRYNVPIETYAVSCVPHKPLCKDLGIKSYPRMMLFLNGQPIDKPIEINVWEIHPFQILRYIPDIDDNIEEEDVNNLLTDSKHEDEDPTTMTKRIRKRKNIDASNIRNPNDHHHQHDESQKSATTTTEFWLPRTKKDIYNDAYLSFDFTMRNIYHAFPLMNTTSDAIEQFVLLLQATLPPSFKLQRTIGDIVANLETVTTNEEALIEILDSYPPPTKTWSHSCRRDDPYKGYTCGLWELFHIMSIGFVEYNMWNIGDDWSFWHANDVAETLRNFIEHFFGCEVCRMNFLHSYEACDHDRCNRLVHKAGTEVDWVEFPLWLFETHNSVNLRLLRERSEGDNRVPTFEEEFSVQWPSRSACRACWHSDGRWDVGMVYSFLRLAYWPEDATSAEHRKLLMQVAAEKDLIEGNGDDDKDDQSVLPMIIIVVVLLSIASMIREKLRLARTGRHKKVDG